MMLSASLAGCAQKQVRTDPGGQPAKQKYSSPTVAGRIESEDISESSGIASSKCTDGVLWTHNDSGDGNFVFAVGINGKLLGKWKVNGADNVDWEDIASYRDQSGKCFLYIGDIGGNAEPRSFQTIYRVAEPSNPTTDGNTAQTEPAERVDFTYPDRVPDAETLLVDPRNADVFVISKALLGNARLFRIPADFQSRSKVVAIRVAELRSRALGGIVTGGDVSPDGRFVVICDYFNGYEFALPDGGAIESAFGQNPRVIDLGERRQGESICYSADGKSIFATSEKRGSPLIRIDAK